MTGKMRFLKLSVVIAPLLLAGCTGEELKTSLTETASSTGQFFSDVGDKVIELGASAGSSISSAASLGRDAMCSPDYYAGQNLAGVIDMTASFLSEANEHYLRGLGEVSITLHGRDALSEELEASYAQFGGANSMAGNLKNANNHTAFAPAVEKILDELAESEMDDDSLRALAKSNQTLYRSNYFQLQAAIGIYKIYNTIQKLGKNDEFIIFLQTNNVDESFQSLMKVPDALRDLAGSLSHGARLYLSISDATDFDASAEALLELGIPADIAKVAKRAKDRADALRKEFPNQLNFEPTGGAMDSLLADNPWAEDAQQKNSAGYLAFAVGVSAVTKALICPGTGSEATS